MAVELLKRTESEDYALFCADRNVAHWKDGMLQASVFDQIKIRVQGMQIQSPGPQSAGLV